MSWYAKVMEVGEPVLGVDTDGVVVEIHGWGAAAAKVGDVVSGSLLNEDEDEEFYIDAHAILSTEEIEARNLTFNEEAYLEYKREVE